MSKFFYKIWLSCIEKERPKKADAFTWEVRSFIYMTMAMTSNAAMIISVIERKIFNSNFYVLNFSFLPDYISNVVSFLLLFIVPISLVNYLLIFHKKNYIKIIDRYGPQNPSIFTIYFVVSMLLPVLLIWVIIFFFQ